MLVHLIQEAVMGRGQGKATDLGNNGDYFYSERWSMCEDGIGRKWFESANHAMRVEHIGGDKYRIVDEKGNDLRGKGRGLRTFKCPIRAMIAADKSAQK
jgi:hypothetical protein